MNNTSLGWKILGLLISIGLIIGGLSGELVLRGTESSEALVGVGVLFLLWDIYSIATHNKRNKKTEEEASAVSNQEAISNEPVYAMPDRPAHAVPDKPHAVPTEEEEEEEDDDIIQTPQRESFDAELDVHHLPVGLYKEPDKQIDSPNVAMPPPPPKQQPPVHDTPSVKSRPTVYNNPVQTYYVLEHQVGSRYHYVGENQKIAVEQVEIGRAPECAVRFDEQFETVSRRHAAIIKEGDEWKLVPISQTNSTFVNGRRVHNEWFLQHNDEIQCALNGPILIFKLRIEN